MNTRRIFLGFKPLLAVAGVLGGFHLQAQSPASPGTLTLTSTLASQYMYRGVRLSGPSFQPDLQYDAGSLALGVWSSLPLVDKVPGQSDPEIDGYGWYKIPLNAALNVQPGFTLYTYPRAEPRNGFYRLTFEPNVALNYTTHGITFTPKVYYDVVLRGPTYELNASYALPVKQIGSEVDFNASIGAYEWKSAVNDAAPDVKGRGDYWSANAALPFQIATNAKLIASIGYTEGSDDFFKQGTAPKQRNPAAVGRAVVTLAYAITW